MYHSSNSSDSAKDRIGRNGKTVIAFLFTLIVIIWTFVFIVRLAMPTGPRPVPTISTPIITGDHCALPGQEAVSAGGAPVVCRTTATDPVDRWHTR